MKHTVTVFRGDGIGPELVDNVLKILEAAKAPLEYEIYNVGEDEWKRNGALIPDEAYASFERTKVLLKSPITTPVGKGFRSLNVTLRGKYDLYANIRPVKSNDAVKTPFKNVDIVIFRENTEGLYVGKEEQIDENTVHAIKIVTKKASERIIRDAFEYAKKNGRKKVTCVHKANILKMSDGMFLAIFREVAKDYPEIEADDKIIDNTCMQLVMNPNQFDVMVMAEPLRRHSLRPLQRSDRRPWSCTVQQHRFRLRNVRSRSRKCSGYCRKAPCKSDRIPVVRMHDA